MHYLFLKELTGKKECRTFSSKNCENSEGINEKKIQSQKQGNSFSGCVMTMTVTLK